MAPPCRGASSKVDILIKSIVKGYITSLLFVLENKERTSKLCGFPFKVCEGFFLFSLLQLFPWE